MTHRNVYGEKLKYCNRRKITGYNRNGRCEVLDDDKGTHIVCCVMTNDFLKFTLSRGNDLITPRGNFLGLIEGDTWCICALRWVEAYKASPKYAPPIIGQSTHENFLYYVPEKIVEMYLIDN